MNEINVLKKWLRDLLANDATLTSHVGTRIYADQAPEASTYPLVIYSVPTAPDTNGLGTVRLLTRARVFVRVVSDGPPTAAARSAADRIDALLQEISADTFESFVFSARREQPIEYTEPKRNAAASYFTFSGGMYRIDIHAA